jgi:DNA-binding MarR family transcriptional regulator
VSVPRVSYVVGRLDRAIRRGLEESLRPMGLSWPQYTMLSVLRARPGLSNAQLARRSLITPQSMSEIVLAMEARGLIVRHTDPTHHRIHRAELTAEGELLLGECDLAVNELEATMLAGLAGEQRERLLDDLRTCVAQLSDDRKDLRIASDA